jgi:hypothetical protein
MTKRQELIIQDVVNELGLPEELVRRIFNTLENVRRQRRQERSENRKKKKGPRR